MKHLQMCFETMHLIMNADCNRNQYPAWFFVNGDCFITTTCDNKGAAFGGYFENLLKSIGIAAILSCFILAGTSGISLAQSNDDETSGEETFQEELAALTDEFEKEGYNLKTLMNDERFEVYGTIGDRFRNSAERTTPTLAEYKEILDFDRKVGQGISFMQEHRQQLQKAQKEYDIPKSLITAIIGIESKYGQILGNYNPFNVYVSMAAVDYRTDFAKAQLRELLEFTNRKELDVFTLKSSYAGAMSPAQFIPYSLNKWWVGRNISDMNHSIMSVANYLAYFKKRTGSLSTAVLRYNPSELYRDAILDLADAIEEAENKSECN